MPKLTYDRDHRSSRDYDADVNHATVRRNFGVTDHKGRMIGGLAYVFDATFKAVGEDARSWYCIPPGLHYGFEPHATRDGRPYGASQRAQYFTTATERDAAVETYFRNAEKRNTKNH